MQYTIDGQVYTLTDAIRPNEYLVETPTRASRTRTSSADTSGSTSRAPPTMSGRPNTTGPSAG